MSKKKVVKIKPRNFVVLNSFGLKGGVMEKTHKQKRKKINQNINKEIDYGSNFGAIILYS